MISIKKHKFGVLFAVLVIALISAAIGNQMKNGAQSQTEESIPAVKLIAVGDFREQKTVRVEGGTVQSLDQADLKSQISAQITAINVKLGDQVQAGQIIMQLQNSDISAQLEQARARLDELKKGARDEELNLARTANNEAKAKDMVFLACLRVDPGVHLFWSERLRGSWADSRLPHGRQRQTA